MNKRQTNKVIYLNSLQNRYNNNILNKLMQENNKVNMKNKMNLMIVNQIIVMMIVTIKIKLILQMNLKEN